jgi:uncharacterized protein (DUF1778 family)
LKAISESAFLEGILGDKMAQSDGNVGVKSTLVMGILAAAVLAGCGGGGVTGEAVGGRIMDGYLVGAKVCFDENANGVCDPSEVFAETAAGGRFSFSVANGTDLSNARLAVEVPATAIDEDSGSPVGSAYRMMGFAGAEAVVNPLTTVVAAHIDSGMTREQAVAQTKTDLGIDFDPAEDYVDSGNAAVHNVARVLAGAFQQNSLISASSIRGALPAIKDAAMAAFASNDELLDANALAVLVDSIEIEQAVSDVVFASGYGAELNGAWIEELSVYKQGDTNEGGIFGWGVSPDTDIWGNTWSGVAASSHANGAFFNWGTWDGRISSSDYIESWVMHPAGVDITGMGRISLKVWGNTELAGEPRFTPSLVSMPIGDCSPTAEYNGALIAAAIAENNDLVDQSAASFQLSFNDFVITESCEGQIASMADFLENDLKTVRVRIYQANTNNPGGINVGPISFQPPLPDVVFASGYGAELNGAWIEELSVYKQGDTNEGGIFGWGVSPDTDIWGNTWSGVAASSHANGAFFNWGTWDGRISSSDYIESWVMHPAGVDITGMGRISLKVWGNTELAGEPRFTPSLVSMPIGDCSPTAEYNGALIAAAIAENNDLVDQSAASFQLSFNDFVITESCEGQIASMADFLENDLKTVRVRIYQANTNNPGGINVGPVSLKP